MKRLLLFVIVLAALLAASAALAQTDAQTLPIDGAAIASPGGTQEAPARFTIPVTFGQTFQIVLEWEGDAYLFGKMTLPDGTYVSDVSRYPGQAESGRTNAVHGPFRAMQDGAFGFEVYGGGEPYPFSIRVISVETVDTTIDGTAAVTLAAGGEAFVAFPAVVNDRVDVFLDSELDTELLAISPMWTPTSAVSDGGAGLNAELTSYWIRETGWIFLRVMNASASSGDVAVTVAANPIPEISLGGSTFTIVPNPPFMPIYVLRYEAGQDYYIRVETVSGASDGNIFIQFFRDGLAGDVLIGDRAASLGYTFHAVENGEVVITIQDNLEPTNEYRIHGGAFFAG